MYQAPTWRPSPRRARRQSRSTLPATTRITLNAQVIHDPTLATIWWHLNGTATRLDNFSLEGGGKNVQLISADARFVTSTALFVKATKGQTIQINPSLTCVYTSGAYHQANFMYATEYLGPL